MQQVRVVVRFLYFLLVIFILIRGCIRNDSLISTREKSVNDGVILNWIGDYDFREILGLANDFKFVNIVDQGFFIITMILPKSDFPILEYELNKKKYVRSMANCGHPDYIDLCKIIGLNPEFRCIYLFT